MSSACVVAHAPSEDFLPADNAPTPRARSDNRRQLTFTNQRTRLRFWALAGQPRLRYQLTGNRQYHGSVTAVPTTRAQHNLSNKFKAIVVDALRSSFPISLLLDIVSLSSSSFYYQLKALKGPSKYAELTEVVTKIVEDSGFSYGYRRVWIQLKKLGIKVSEKVVRRIISAEGLTVRYVKKRRRYSSYRGEISDAPPNLVKRNFHAEAPGLLWLTDISEFPADDGKIYFSALVDCFDGKIVGATTSRHPNQQLADDCLKQALENNAPPDPAKLVVHSDRGCHYRGNSWIQASQDIGFTRT